MALRLPSPSSISTRTPSSSATPSSSSPCARFAALMTSFKRECTALAWAPILSRTSQTPLSSIGAASSQVATTMDESDTLTLATIRDSLIRQEDSIIYSLIERAQYNINRPTYDANRFSIPGFEGSLVEYMLKETESLHAKVELLLKRLDKFYAGHFAIDLGGTHSILSDTNFAGHRDCRKFTSGYFFTFTSDTVSWIFNLQKCVALTISEADQSVIMLARNPVFHAKTKHIEVKYHFIKSVLDDKAIELVEVRRYQSPDEHPYFPDLLPAPLLPPLHYPQILHKCAPTININSLIWKLYFDELLPRFSTKGDDGNYGSTAVCDVLCLQALSKRIHYGKFVAEAKFRESPELFESAIRAKDEEALMSIITYEAVEEKVQKRVEEKARTYGQEVDSNGINPSPQYKIEPSQVAHLYGKWVMPLTKQVQVQYLLQRLD
ncbi:hypothetical protein L7F22_034610 [Adiantum nelumboides]|nr:hypothetical protein [Adiantum nelumboides]